MKPDPDGNNGCAWVLPASLSALVVIYLAAELWQEIKGWF